MSLISSSIMNNVELHLWKIEESIEELSLIFNCPTPDFRANNKKKEWLIERIMIKKILGENVDLNHLENGQPILTGSNKYISISHTKDYVIIGFSNYSNFGIDIEHYSNRVNNITKHFVLESENCEKEDEKTGHNLVLWSAKESVFKALRNGTVNIMKNTIISPFHLAEQGTLYAKTSYEKGSTMESKIEYLLTNEYVLTVARFLE